MSFFGACDATRSAASSEEPCAATGEIENAALAASGRCVRAGSGAEENSSFAAVRRSACAPACGDALEEPPHGPGLTPGDRLIVARADIELAFLDRAHRSKGALG